MQIKGPEVKKGHVSLRMFKAKLGKPSVVIPPPPSSGAVDDTSATYQEPVHVSTRDKEEVMTEYSCSCTDVTLDEKYCIAHNHTQSVANRSVNKAVADQSNLLSHSTDATKVELAICL